MNTMCVCMGVNWVGVLTGWNILPCCCYGHLGDATSCLPHWCCLATVAPPCQSHGWFLKWGFHLLALNENRKRKQEAMVSRGSHTSLREAVCKKVKLIKCTTIHQSNLIVHIHNMMHNLILPLYRASPLMMIIAVLNMFNSLFYLLTVNKY